MGRDRGKGKGGGRGGGRGAGQKMYIANIEELEKREREVGGKERAHADDDDEEEEEEEGEEHQKGGETVFAFERKAGGAAAAAGRAAGAGEEDATAGVAGLTISNPNRAPKPLDASNPEAGMNRKEREALAAAKAKEDYQRRHMAGETEQAKRELAQLALVRARREAAAKKREAEGRPPGWTENGVDSDNESGSDDESEDEKGPKVPPGAVPPSIAKKKAALEKEEAEAAADGGIPKLKAMDIKKMNGDALKDHLKERGLDTQGQKKDLMKRLIDYEAARA
eukprot:gene3545-3882_t